LAIRREANNDARESAPHSRMIFTKTRRAGDWSRQRFDLKSERLIGEPATLINQIGYMVHKHEAGYYPAFGLAMVHVGLGHRKDALESLF
jgi:hypothetical protein